MDTTAMPKQGMYSEGVARQGRGRPGKVANCQAWVFVADAATRG